MNHHEQVIKILKETFGNREISGIEIGTGGGGLTTALLLYLPNLTHIYTIDPWQHRDGVEFEASFPQETLNIMKYEAYRRFKEYSDRVSVFAVGSDEAKEILPIKEVDFVWIDGDHTLQQVKRDIINYRTFIKQNGILGGHDLPTIYPVIEELFQGNVNKGDDLTWWIYC